MHSWFFTKKLENPCLLIIRLSLSGVWLSMLCNILSFNIPVKDRCSEVQLTDCKLDHQKCNCFPATNLNLM